MMYKKAKFIVACYIKFERTAFVVQFYKVLRMLVRRPTLTQGYFKLMAIKILKKFNFK